MPDGARFTPPLGGDDAFGFGRRPSSERRVVVIGAGVAGLAATVDLAAAGVSTVLLERAATPGGKMRAVEIGGSPIDAGPTVLTMRWVFDGLFDTAGAALDDALTLHPAKVLARHAWADDDAGAFDLHADLDAASDAIDAFFGGDEALRYRRFTARAKRIHDALEKPFMAAERAGPIELMRRLGAATTLELARIAPLTPLWTTLGGVFKDQRLRQLFARYATYCGSSPFAAPAVLMLVAHVEQAGVWRIEGGMRRLATALADLAARRGAAIRYGAEVDEVMIDGGRAVGVRLATGEEIRADAVVSAADAGALAIGLLGDRAAQSVKQPHRRNRSLSAVVWSVKASPSNAPSGDGSTQGDWSFPLAHHTVFFAPTYRPEFDAIFRRRRLPDEPTVYICAQDRDDVGAPLGDGGAERLHLLVNAPPDGDLATAVAPGGPLSDAEIDRCETTMIALLKRCGLELTLAPETTIRTTPAMFDQLFPGTGGALYGPANHGPFGTFQRAGGRTRIPGLHLASGSVHPGPGVPMAALSGRLAAARILSDFASEPRLRPAAISGGMSTA